MESGDSNPAQRRALVVDDSFAVRTALATILESFGYAVEKAQNGAAALQLARSLRLDVIFLDLQMPVLDGPSFLRCLQVRGDHPPVVLLTGEHHTRVLAAAIRLGAADFLAKPFLEAQVQAVLQRVLRAGPTSG
jgi:two-component system OmpR family response regulator